MKPEVSCSESARLAALYRYNILDTPSEAAFDELTELASVLFKAPIAVVNFIDCGRQWFKSEIGLGVRETPLETSFCAHALLQEDLLVVPDARDDVRFADNPLVTSGPKLRFYAGALLKSNDGFAIGTLCILDYQPREFDLSQQHTLRVLANQVMAQLEQRRLLQESESNRQELARLNQQLLEQDRSKDESLAMISHELRNPLSATVMALELLSLKGPLSQGVADGLSIIKRQTKYLARLVEDLLDVSRVATGKISLHKQVVQLSEVVHRSVEIVQMALQEKGHTLRVNLPDEQVLIFADEVRICQVFSNLLGNAIRYTPEGGCISLDAKWLDTTRVEVVVSDNGIGISGEYLERIFESFVQAPSSNKGHNRGGLGIGLHLSQHIVHLHEGSISAASDGIDCGSRFTVTLPAKRAAKAS